MIRLAYKEYRVTQINSPLQSMCIELVAMWKLNLVQNEPISMKAWIVFPILIMLMLLLGGYIFFAHQHEDVVCFAPVYAFYLMSVSHFTLSGLIPRCLQHKFAYSRLDTPQLAAGRLHYSVLVRYCRTGAIIDRRAVRCDCHLIWWRMGNIAIWRVC